MPLSEPDDLVQRVLQQQKQVSFTRLKDPPLGVPRYSINDTSYYSVTQILDTDADFSGVDPTSLIHSQIVGSITHLSIENFLKGRDLDTNLSEALSSQEREIYNTRTSVDDSKWQKYLQGESSESGHAYLINKITRAFDFFTDFLANHHLELIFAEDVVWNSTFMYAGTVDLLCKLDG